MIWNSKYECMSREEMRELQGEKLRKIVAHAYHNSPFYKARFDEHGVRPEDIKTIDAFRATQARCINMLIDKVLC